MRVGIHQLSHASLHSAALSVAAVVAGADVALVVVVGQKAGSLRHSSLKVSSKALRKEAAELDTMSSCGFCWLVDYSWQ